MSPHPITDEQLIAYANHELDGSSAAAVAAHVINCTRCKKFIALFRLVRAMLRHDDSRAPSSQTLQKAQALGARRRASSAAPLRQLRPAHAALALVLGLLALMLGMLIGVATQEISSDSALHPLKSAVESFQTTVSDTWRSLGGSRAPTQPSRSPTPSKSPANRVAQTPSPMPNNPGQPPIPPEQIKAPPGQAQTPPGQINPPPGKVITPPGKIHTPPGKIITPPGKIITPPGKIHTPADPKNEPPGKNDGPPKDDKDPPDKKNK